MTSSNTADDTAIVRQHVQALVRMLLPGRKMKQSVVLLAGDTLGDDTAMELSSMAAESNIDLVHLAFARVDGRYSMVEINVAMPRDHGCYFFGGCQLTMPEGARRALLMPRDPRQGHFVVTPGEVMHFKTKRRAALEEGVQRAQDRLSQLLRQELDVSAQGFIHELETVP